MEYVTKTDPSMYVLFPVDENDLMWHTGYATLPSLNLLVWTTTPWTLPLNQAVAVAVCATYVVCELMKNGEPLFLVVAQSFLPALGKLLGEYKVLGNITSLNLTRLHVRHPTDNRLVPVVEDELVHLVPPQDSTGYDVPTGCVHVAPSCGPEDFVAGELNGLPLTSFVEPNGCYSKDLPVPELASTHYLDALPVVRRLLGSRLFFEATLDHQVSACWRCKAPLLFRATQQWFCSLGNLLPRVLAALDSVQFHPAEARKTFAGLLGGREEWCVSRQRSWGVPVVALHCPCGQALLTPEMVEYVAAGTEREGLEFWQNLDPAVLAVVCSACGNTDGFRKETDCLDVWFDSGCSAAAVLQSGCYPAGSYPATVYLEGKDQHRGWFQSAFLCNMLTQGRLPTANVVCHGFLVDEKGEKYSKSRGNGVRPQDVWNKYNADVVRLWACASPFTGDMVGSEATVNQAAQNYRKVRTTLRFFLANLTDYREDVPYNQLPLLDQCMMADVQQWLDLYHSAMKSFELWSAVKLLMKFAAKRLTNFYFPMVRPRLYFEAKDSPARRAAQTTLNYLFQVFVRLLAPVLSFVAEEAFLCFKEMTGLGGESVHLSTLLELPTYSMNSVLVNYPQFQTVESLSSAWKHFLQLKKDLAPMVAQTAYFEHSLELAVDNPELMLFLELCQNPEYRYQLEDMLQVVELHLCSAPKTEMKTQKCPLGECKRCRRANCSNANLCVYCVAVLSQQLVHTLCDE